MVDYVTDMSTIRPIIILPDPLLRLVSKPVTAFDARVQALVDDMFATMYDAMTLVDLDSKTRGYQAWHFSAFPWLLGEIEKTPNPENIVRSQSRDLDNLFMLEDLESYKLGINDPRTSHKYNPHDDHPTPECQWKWLKQVILPEIKIDLDLGDRVKLDQQRVLQGDVN